jgi:hypothetical protein
MPLRGASFPIPAPRLRHFAQGFVSRRAARHHAGRAAAYGGVDNFLTFT